MDHFPTNWGRPVCSLEPYTVSYCWLIATSHSFGTSATMRLTRIAPTPSTNGLSPKTPSRMACSAHSTSSSALLFSCLTIYRQPIVTGTSVLAIQFKDGIMMAADNLGMFSPRSFVHLVSFVLLASYGSLARFKDVQRLHAVGDYTCIGASGDMSDLQYIQGLLDSVMIDEFTAAVRPSQIPFTDRACSCNSRMATPSVRRRCMSTSARSCTRAARR